MVKEEQKDDRLVRKQQIASFVGSNQYKELLTDLEDLMVGTDTELANASKGFVSQDGLARLNFNLGKKSGLQLVLNTLQGYQDELA